MKAFDGWLVKHGYLQSGETVFVASISEKVPEWIAMWILDEYDFPTTCKLEIWL